MGGKPVITFADVRYNDLVMDPGNKSKWWVTGKLVASALTITQKGGREERSQFDARTLVLQSVADATIKQTLTAEQFDAAGFKLYRR